MMWPWRRFFGVKNLDVRRAQELAHGLLDPARPELRTNALNVIKRQLEVVFIDESEPEAQCCR